MEWKNKRVLVTGAGGFIGSHLVERLVSNGAKVRAFVHYNSRGDPGRLQMVPADFLAQVEFLAGDLRDAQTVREAMEGVEVVFHLGALISIPYSYRHPAEVAETNLMGTLNVLMACRDLKVERLIHTSSSEVYGTAQYTPIDEEHPLHGQSPYAASKIGADKLVESFHCTYDLPVVTVRPFNTYGPRQSGRAVIPTIITQALVNSLLKLGNVDTKRDFTFIDDTVNGFLRAGETPGIEGRTYNLGTGEAIRVSDLVDKILQKLSKVVTTVVDPARLRPEGSEVMHLISDNQLARQDLKWQPVVSLDDGLNRTITWIQKHLDLYQVGTYEF
ncbi:MAG TPA: SDR family NAD(P)-dependent oxidoreductase [Anaerolineales bacterium]|nr:SDR family NAD(P)-dependent oxidoreductase [Anaerolineales bacterium]